jgi:hypothetical protein
LDEFFRRVSLRCRSHKGTGVRGADDPRNMQWQTTAAAKQKARWELAECKTAR